MLQHQPAKVFPLEFAILGFTRFTLGIFKDDNTVFIGDDIVFTDDAPV